MWQALGKCVCSLPLWEYVLTTERLDSLKGGSILGVPQDKTVRDDG